MRSTRHVLMRQRWLHSDESFDYDVLDLLPYILLPIVLSNVIEDVMQVSLVAGVIFSPRLIVVRVLVDGIVCKMHEDVFEVTLKRALVRHCRESSEPFLMDEHSEWAHSIDHNVDAHVEF